MKIEELKLILNYMVTEGQKVNKEYLDEEVGQVDYVAIFCRDEKEKRDFFSYEKFRWGYLGNSYGPNYKLNTPINTKSGEVRLIKIRNTDPAKSHRGAPDFRVKD